MNTDLEELIRNTLERDARRAPTQLAQHSMSPVNRPWPRSRNWGYVLGAAAVTATVAIIGIGQAFHPSDQTTASAPNRSDGSALCREIAPKIGLNAELLRAGEFDSEMLDEWLRTSPYGSERPLNSYSGIDAQAPTTILCVFTTDGYPTSGLAGRPGTGLVDGSRVLMQSASAWSMAGVGPSEFFVRGFDDLTDQGR